MLLGHEHFYGIFQEAVERIAASGPVLDVGTTHTFRKELEPFAHLFHDYVAMDFHAEAAYGDRNVHIDADIHRLPIRSEAIGGLLCIEVLEHVTDPRSAIQELQRVLKRGGRLLLTTPFMQGFHGKAGDYPDFFRFTDEGLHLLLNGFSEIRIHPKGGLIYRLLTTLTPARFHLRILRSKLLMRAVNALDKKRPTRSPTGWIVEARK